VRNRLLIFGAIWWFVLALIPALVAFREPFSVSPFLVSAFLLAAASGAYGTLVAGRKAGERRYSRLSLGVLQAVVVALLAAVTIWLAMAANMSGFNLVESPAQVLNLFRQPSIFIEAGIVGLAVLVYSIVVGALLSPLTGTVIARMVSGRKDV
jgi:hypothetical protein